MFGWLRKKSKKKFSGNRKPRILPKPPEMQAITPAIRGAEFIPGLSKNPEPEPVVTEKGHLTVDDLRRMFVGPHSGHPGPVGMTGQMGHVGTTVGPSNGYWEHEFYRTLMDSQSEEQKKKKQQLIKIKFGGNK